MWLGPVVVAACFLIGGLPAGLLIARSYGIADIRRYGSGNIGASNVLRTVGVKPALVVWLVDIAKGALPTVAAGIVLQHGDWWHASAAFATVVGHCFSPYLGFRGGRGVATGLGVMIAIEWRAGLLAFAIWIVLTAITRYISLSSVLAALSCSPLYLLFGGDSKPLLVCVVSMGVLITVRHMPNLRRLLAGTEHKIGQRVTWPHGASGHEQPDQ